MDLDLRWSHNFLLRKAQKDKSPAITVGVDAFNVLNQVSYQTFVGIQTSPLFGQPDTAFPARSLQFAFRFKF